MSIKDMLAESQGSTSYFNGDTPVGATITGTITSTAIRQATNFQTKEPEFWDDGNPKQQIVITLATNERDASNVDDDGARSIYIKWWGLQRSALTQAVKESGDDDIRPGGTFTATYVRQDAPAKKGLSGTKIFVYTYQPPSATAGVFAQPETPAAAPAPAAAAPTAPPADPAAALDTIKTLIKSGLTDQQIAAAIPAFPLDAIVAVRSTLAAA